MHYLKLDLNLLVVFRALMVHRSVTAASEALNLTQSTVSHALSRLRRSYDDALFVRVGTAMEPTARALEMDGSVQDALSKIAGTLKSEFVPQRLARQFRVGLVNFGGLYMVPALLGKLATEAPNASVRADHIPLDKAVKQLEKGEFDLLIGDFGSRKSAWEKVHLLTDELCVVAAGRHPTLGESVSAKQLGALRHIHVPFFESYEPILHRHGVRRTFQSSTDNLLSVLFLVGRSDTVAIVPRTVARIYSGVYGLKLLDLPFEFPRMEIDLAFRRADRHDAAHRWLREIIIDIAVEIGLTFGTAMELIRQRGTARPRAGSARIDGGAHASPSPNGRTASAGALRSRRTMA
jgi:DNA-binding transcriptional LysR family regulator